MIVDPGVAAAGEGQPVDDARPVRHAKARPPRLRILLGRAGQDADTGAAAGDLGQDVAGAAVRRHRHAGAEMIARQTPEALALLRSEEHTSELQSLMRISYAVFCLKKKKQRKHALTKHRT